MNASEVLRVGRPQPVRFDARGGPIAVDRHGSLPAARSRQVVRPLLRVWLESPFPL